MKLIDLSGLEQREKQWRLQREQQHAAWCLWLAVFMLFVLSGCALYVMCHLEAFRP